MEQSFDVYGGDYKHAVVIFSWRLFVLWYCVDIKEVNGDMQDQSTKACEGH